MNLRFSAKHLCLRAIISSMIFWKSAAASGGTALAIILSSDSWRSSAGSRAIFHARRPTRTVFLEFFVGVGGRGKGLHEVQEDFGHLLLSGRIPIDAGPGTHKTGRYELALQVVIYTQLAVSPFFLRARCHKSLLVVKADWREWYRL